MDRQLDLQIVQLTGLELGQFMTIILTGATGGGNCVLEFKNGSDPAWTVDPNFNGTVTAGRLVERVKCLSGQTRIRFLADPAGTPYFINLVWDVVPHF
jgi:hypothetical protein